MLNVLLLVPHFEQSRDGACLPACVQMVLSHLGDVRTEADFSKLLGTKEYGTPIRNAERLREEGYDVQVCQLTRKDLESYLEAGLPIIVRVWTIMLDYWHVTTSHVVVVVGCDDSSVFLNDPAFSTAPQPVVWDAFLAAWAEYDETAVVISNP
jgi:ABC-type bacteriocin/lantibiotic exporter with double-glycine peptidase domain